MSAHAQQQPPTPPRQDQGDRILREEMERERERLLRQPTPRVEQPAAPAAVGQDPAEVAEIAPMFRIEHIELQGGELLPAGVLARRLRPFTGRDLGTVRIGLLLQGLNADLIEAGLITSRAYVVSQNLASGVLSLRIVPGRIEAIRYNGSVLADDALDAPGVRLALPMGVGDILQLRDIEQGLDQLNRLRGRQAQVRIVPGQSPGGSVLEFVRGIDAARCASLMPMPSLTAAAIFGVWALVQLVRLRWLPGWPKPHRRPACPTSACHSATISRS